MRQWLDENLPPRITEVVKDTAPAAIGKVLTNPESEQYATLVDKVSERIWTRYLDPNIEDSPLPLMVQTLVVTELGASAPPTGTVPTPGPHLGLTDRAAPPQDLPPTENLNNQPEETRSRTVYLPVAGGAPDPDDEGGPSADEDPHRNGRGRRDKHGRSARGGANGKAKRAESDDSEDDESDHGRPRRKKGDKKHKGSDNSSDSDESDCALDRGRRRTKLKKQAKKKKRRSRRYESDHYDSSDQSSSSSSSDSDSDYYRDRRSRKRRHRHGKRHSRKPTVIRPTNDIFSRAVDYRSYRLVNRKQEYTERIQRSMGKYEKRMKVQMAHHRFNGKDPITVLDFLARFKDSCDRNNISEAAAVWCFQYFLDGQAANVVKTRLSGRSLAVDASRADMLTSYEEVVQFLLKTYATEEAMAEAITDVENFKQSSSMDVQAYSDELWTRALRCGSVISSTRLKGYFIQGVLPAIRAGVRYYATEHPDATYEAVLSKARSLGDAYMAAKRATSAPRGSVSAAKTVKPKRTAFQIEADASTASSSSTDLTPGGDDSMGADVLAMSYGTSGAPPTPPSYPTTPSYRSAAPTSPRNYGQQYSTPPQTLPPALNPVSDPTRQLYGSKGCRICLSLDHTVCPLISDPAARERLMKIREANFRLRRGEAPRQFAQKPYGQGRQAGGSTPMNGNNHTQVRNQYVNDVETVEDAVEHEASVQKPDSEKA